MRTVESMELLLAIAERLGYAVRHEWLGGSGGGACEFAGRKWIFVDLAISPDEQLEQVAAALRADPAIHLADLSPVVQQQLDLHRAA